MALGRGAAGAVDIERVDRDMFVHKIGRNCVGCLRIRPAIACIQICRAVLSMETATDKLNDLQVFSIVGLEISDQAAESVKLLAV